jgi:hypothetical protein
MKSIFASFVVLAACGGSPLDPGAGSSLGTGTNTLSVDGNARAHAELANAKSASDFTTDFEVAVMLNNAPVTTGTVEVKSTKATTELTYDGNGSWHGTAAGYDEAYELNVISGADKVMGVIVDGPDIHTFTAPQAGATLDSTMPNPMTWSRAAAADVATLRVGDLDRITVDDTGSFMIPAGSLKAEKDQARTNQLVLTRENHVAPKGAVAGSTFSVSIDNELDVIAQPNPAL